MLKVEQAMKMKKILHREGETIVELQEEMYVIKRLILARS